MFGFTMKKKYYPEVKRLYRSSSLTTPSSNDEVVLIPGLNLFKNGSFKQLQKNNLTSSLFAYKEHIYLNSDRFVDEGEIVYNELQFLPNIKLFGLTGRFMNGLLHEEMKIEVSNNQWTLKKYNLCKDIKCSGVESKKNPSFVLKYENNQKFFKYCQVDQLDDDINAETAGKHLVNNKRFNNEHYVKSLSKCYTLIKEFIKKENKTNIGQDIKDLVMENFKNEQQKEILNFALSQKKILYFHSKLFLTKIGKEMQKEIFNLIN